MIDGEIKRFIQQEIKRHLDVILPGQSGNNTEQAESILNLYPGMPEIESRPVMHPFGMVSRAPNNTIQVNGRSGDHPGSRMVLGHRDKTRPTDIEQGEMVIYASDGTTVLRRVNVKLDQIQIGSSNADEPLVLGNVMVEFCRQWIDNWLDAPHIGISPVGPVYMPPAIRQKFIELKQIFLDAADTNIISQENFTERKNES